MKKTLTSMTEGKPSQLILAFALPLFLGNLFQQVFVISDTMIVGHLIGDGALAAIGATGPIYLMLMTFLNGASQGFGMILARYFGAKDFEGIKRAAGSSLFLALTMVISFTVGGFFIASPLLTLLRTPDYIMADSQVYLRIMFTTLLFTMSFQLTTGMLQALGNSKVPVFTQSISILLNIVLNFWLVNPNGLNMGVAGAAWGTVLSQLIAAIFNLIYISAKVPELHLHFNHLKPDGRLVAELFQLALSIGFGNAIIQIGSIILQFSINALGVNTITAFTTARRVFNITFLPLISTSAAVATFTSQNVGAGKYDRLTKGLAAGFKIVTVWSLLCIVVTFTMGEEIIGFLSGSTDSQVLAEGALYLKISMPFLIFLNALVLCKGYFNGMGDKHLPFISSVIELFGKIIAVAWIIPKIGFVGIAFTEPLIWLVITIFLLLFVYKKFKGQRVEAF